MIDRTVERLPDAFDGISFDEVRRHVSEHLILKARIEDAERLGEQEDALKRMESDRRQIARRGGRH